MHQMGTLAGLDTTNKRFTHQYYKTTVMKLQRQGFKRQDCFHHDLGTRMSKAYVITQT